MRIECLHPWGLTPKEAVALQRQLVGRVRVTRPRRRRFDIVAGADMAIDKAANRGFAAVVVMESAGGAVLEEVSVSGPLEFPYVPGLLSFREIPLLLQALGQLRATPHAIICDGQGLAHPRRLGLATHLGLCLDVPTIGSAKSRLCGEATDILERRRGSRVPLVDNGEQVGEVVRTRDGVKPLWVSPGNRIDFATATGIVLANATRFRLPEPQRRADRLAAETKRAAAKES